VSGPHVEDPPFLPPNRPRWVPPQDMDPAVARSWSQFYSSIRTAYGMTPQDYRDLYVAQHGCCFICRTAKGKHPDDPKGRGGRRLGVDHNHALGNTKGAVRGLLCSGGDRTCNRIIGWLNLAQLKRAVEYLEEPPAPSTFSARAEMDAIAAANAMPFPDPDGFLRQILHLS
jgi:recombination endonuclease VII